MVTLVLSYSACRDDGVAIITPPADLGVNTAVQLEVELNAALLRGIRTLIVDLSGTTFCDSAGITILSRAYELASDMNTTMCLVITKANLRKLFEINGIDQTLKIFDSVPAAEQAGEPADAAPWWPL